MKYRRRANTKHLHNPIIAQSTKCGEQIVFDTIDEELFESYPRMSELSKSKLCNCIYKTLQEWCTISDINLGGQKLKSSLR